MEFETKNTKTSQNESFPFPIFLPDPLPSNPELIKRFLRLVIIKLNSFYRKRYFSYQDTLESLNGPMYYPIMMSVLRQQHINPALFNLITCFEYLGKEGRLPVRYKAIQRMLIVNAPRMYVLLKEAKSLDLIDPQNTPNHPDGKSYQLTYRGHELFKRVSKEFYKRIMSL